jgi:hypothetical protein
MCKLAMETNLELEAAAASRAASHGGRAVVGVTSRDTKGSLLFFGFSPTGCVVPAVPSAGPARLVSTPRARRPARASLAPLSFPVPRWSASAVSAYIECARTRRNDPATINGCHLCCLGGTRGSGEAARCTAAPRMPWLGVVD